MASRLTTLCFDAVDPLRLAQFRASVLRWAISDTSPDEVALDPTDGTPFSMVFLRVSEPKVDKNRVHLDIVSESTEHQTEMVERLVSLGARHVDVGQVDVGQVDEDGDTAIRATDGQGPFITFGPPVDSVNSIESRLHLDVAPMPDGDQDAEVDRLIATGARRVDIGQGEVSWVVLADPEDNKFRVLRPLAAVPRLHRLSDKSR